MNKVIPLEMTTAGIALPDCFGKKKKKREGGWSSSCGMSRRDRGQRWIVADDGAFGWPTVRVAQCTLTQRDDSSPTERSHSPPLSRLFVVLSSPQSNTLNSPRSLCFSLKSWKATKAVESGVPGKEASHMARRPVALLSATAALVISLPVEHPGRNEWLSIRLHFFILG